MDDDTPFKLHVALEQQGAPRSRWWHPILKALGAFFLTTVLAGLIGAFWQSRHWAEQQAFALRNETAKARLDLANSVVRRVGETFGASSQLVYLIIFSTDGPFSTTRDEQLNKALEEWFADQRRWLVEEQSLLAETAASFENQEIAELLRKVINQRNALFTQVTEFVQAAGGKPLPPVGTKERDDLLSINEKIFSAKSATTGTDGLLLKLATLMIAEARMGQQPPTGWWDFLPRR